MGWMGNGGQHPACARRGAYGGEEILEVELSKAEFAEAIGVKANSDFVEHFFSLMST